MYHDIFLSLLNITHRLVSLTMNKLTCILNHWVELINVLLNLLYSFNSSKTLSRSGQSSVMISGGSHCTPIGQTGTVAEPNSTLVINCTVTNPLNLANLLHWNIPYMMRVLTMSMTILWTQLAVISILSLYLQYYHPVIHQ